MMQFDEFVHALDGAIGSPAHAAPGGREVRWSAGRRAAAVALVPPLNVSVTLEGEGAPVTTWYPVDAALVPVVSNRISGFLSEA